MSAEQIRFAEKVRGERLCRCVAAGERCRKPLTGTGDYCSFCRAWGCDLRGGGPDA